MALMTTNEAIITAKPNERLALAFVNDDYEWAYGVADKYQVIECERVN